MCYRPPHVPFSMPVTLGVDGLCRTIQPERPEGDAFFGLELGTNGTAAAARRLAVERAHHVAGGFVWLRANGKPATGLQFVPSDRSDNYEANPWSGR
jgi:hypothetical protein